MKLTLIRHGLTEGNIRRLYYGAMDLPLLPDNIGRLAVWDYSADSLAALCEVLRGGEGTGRMPVKI